MAQIVIMPKEGITVESCLVGVWYKNIGEEVSVNDVLFEYETDKAVFECLSTAAGVLLHKFYEPGGEVPVLAPVAIIGEAGEDVSALVEDAVQLTPVTAASAGEGEDWLPEEGEVIGGSAGWNAPEASAGWSESEAQGADEQPASPYVDEGSAVWSAPEEREDASEETSHVDEDMEVIASPRARGFAEEYGVDLAGIEPTGPAGRILEGDVIRALEAESAEAPRDGETEAVWIAPAAEAPAVDGMPEAPHVEEAAVWIAPAAEAPAVDEIPEASQGEEAAVWTEPAQEESAEAARDDESDVEYEDEAFSKIRATIAKAMTVSLQRSAQLTHHHSFDATNILAMREDFKSSDEALGFRDVSVGDIILYVASRVLAKHPEINALVAETGMRKYYTVNLGVAIDTPRGLMVPTVFGAEKKSLKDISREVKTLAAACREGNINPDLLTGGTFTVSNLGATGVEVFTPIINPPQAAIAGICGVTDRVRKGRGGRPEAYPSIGISLTYDHRAVDGAPASRFAAELCEALAGFSWKTLALEKATRFCRHERREE